MRLLIFLILIFLLPGCRTLHKSKVKTDSSVVRATQSKTDSTVSRTGENLFAWERETVTEYMPGWLAPFPGLTFYRPLSESTSLSTADPVPGYYRQTVKEKGTQTAKTTEHIQVSAEKKADEQKQIFTLEKAKVAETGITRSGFLVGLCTGLLIAGGVAIGIHFIRQKIAKWQA